MIFGGLKIIEHPFLSRTVPKIQISANFTWCTPEFRAEYNEWLRSRFGEVQVGYMLSGPFGDFMAVGPGGLDSLRRVVKVISDVDGPM